MPEKLEIQPMQIYPSKKLHAAFKAKCATEKGNPPMNRKILELMEQWINKPEALEEKYRKENER